jgi:putative ABC transport system permease protein
VSIIMRQTLRVLTKEPAFAMTVTVVMGLSIGFCTAIFSLVNSVLLQQLPYKAADRLAVIWHTNGESADVTGVWARDYGTYRDTARSFESLGAFTTEGYNLSHHAEPARVICARMTANLLPMLAVNPARGRWFTAEDDRDGATATVILSDDLWRSRFGSDDAVLGKTIRLNAKPYTVVGIMPPSFTFPPEGVRNVASAECWVPARFSPMELAAPSFNWVVMGRLKPGVSFGQTQQDASAIAQVILESYPAAVQKEVALRARVIALHDEISGRSRAPLLVFSGSVGFLLLIGCANAANLMLARLNARQREIAMRAALGATPAVLTRQILAESALLAACGGLVGIPMAFGLLRLLQMFGADAIPMLHRVHLDAAVLVFTIACAVLAGILSGLVPAVGAGAIRTAATMAEGTRTASGGRRYATLRSALALTEIALALVLLVASGLLIRSYLELASVPPGFDPNNVVTFSVALPEGNYKDAIQVCRFVDTVLERIPTAGEVTFTSAGSSFPSGPAEATVFSRIGAPPAIAGFKPALIHTVTPGYFHTLRIASVRGRIFDAHDDASRTPVAVVNEAMARQYWPETDVIGQELYWLVGGRSLTVVGVVEDVRDQGPAAGASPAFYIPLAQSPQSVRNLVFAVRTAQPAPGLAGAIRRLVAEIDPSLPVFSLQPAVDRLRNSIADQRFNMFVVTVFAVCALTLSLFGIYAVISYGVAQSSRELATRMALGASPRSILRMVLARGFKLVAGGMLAGTVMASMFTQFLRGTLFGVSETDYVTFLAVTAFLGGVAFLAIVVPAIRATHVDPIRSLQ